MAEKQTLFSLEPLAWESGFFGFKTGKFVLNPIFSQKLMQEENRKENLSHFAVIEGLPWQEYQVIQSKIEMSDLASIDLLTHLDFKLAEGEIDFLYSKETINPSASPYPLDENEFKQALTELTANFTIDVELSAATVDDIKALKTISQHLFEQSRFRTPWFKTGQSGEFYATWIEKAVLGQFDDICFVIKTKEKGLIQDQDLYLEPENNPRQDLMIEDKDNSAQSILGFVSLRLLENGEVRIGLLGSLNKKLKKKQPIGTCLIEIAKLWSRVKHGKALYVATQSSNIPAMRLYVKTGAVISQTSYWMYKSHSSDNE